MMTSTTPFLTSRSSLCISRAKQIGRQIGRSVRTVQTQETQSLPLKQSSWWIPCVDASSLQQSRASDSFTSWRGSRPPLDSIRLPKVMPAPVANPTTHDRDRHSWSPGSNEIATNVIKDLRTQKFSFVSADEMRKLLAIFSNVELDEQTLRQFKSCWAEGGKQEDGMGNVVQPWKSTLLSHYHVGAGDLHRSNQFNWPESGVHQQGEPDEASLPRVWEIVDPDTPPPLRVHKQWPLRADHNPWMRALLRMSAHVAREAAPSTQLRFETRKEEAAGSRRIEMLGFRVGAAEQGGGEPTPEGVHQDNGGLAITILMQRRNVADGGAASRVWPMTQPNGPPGTDDTPMASKVMMEPLEAIFFWDSDVKHDVTSFGVDNPELGPAERDLLAVLVDPHFDSTDLSAFRP